MTQAAEREGLQPSENSEETRSAAGSGFQRVTPRLAELVREARSQAPPWPIASEYLGMGIGNTEQALPGSLKHHKVWELLLQGHQRVGGGLVK